MRCFLNQHDQDDGGMKVHARQYPPLPPPTPAHTQLMWSGESFVLNISAWLCSPGNGTRESGLYILHLSVPASVSTFPSYPL